MNAARELSLAGEVQYCGRKGGSMHEGVKSGIGFGTALAITISWSKWHSILWAMIHGVLSWVYVVYYALTR